MKKIVVLGPESTGKSTLSVKLAAFFQCPCVQEYAREYLNDRDGKYAENDLLYIAKGQIQLERKAEKEASELLVLDTDLTVIKIWSLVKYRRCNPWILDMTQKRVYDLYLLTYPDIPWAPDPLREHAEKSLEIFSLYESELQNRNLAFEIIKGKDDERFVNAVKIIKSRFGFTKRNTIF